MWTSSSRARLPWKQREAAFNREFPQFKDLVVAVIDGRTPEEADETAAGLAQALAADHAHFRTVRRPDAAPFFDREGLLFLARSSSPACSTIRSTRSPSSASSSPIRARGACSRRCPCSAIGAEQGQADLSTFAGPLRQFHATLAGALAGHPEPLSWQRLLGGSLADQAGPYRFVLAQPVLDYGALEPGGAATDALRQDAAKLPAVAAGRAHVRVTGSVPLADEEFATVAQGALAGTIGSVVLIAVWLFLAVRSWRLIVPILLTLFLGLLLTIGFAALAVGTLNLVSVAFAILFVGIAVDFAIQFSVRFREARLEAPEIAMAPGPHRAARRRADAGRRGGDGGRLPRLRADRRSAAWRSSALIAGVGMLIAFLCTLTFLPAALTLFRPRGEAGEVGLRWLAPLDAPIMRARRPILAVFAVLGVAGAVLLPRVVFDADPLHTKDPNTEAMRTLRDLIDNPLTTPYSADILLPSLAQVPAVADRLRQAAAGGAGADASTASCRRTSRRSSPRSPTPPASSARRWHRHGSQAPVTTDDIRLAAHTAAEHIAQASAKLREGRSAGAARRRPAGAREGARRRR